MVIPVYTTEMLVLIPNKMADAVIVETPERITSITVAAKRICRNCKFWGAVAGWIERDGWKECSKISENTERHYHNAEWYKEELARTVSYEESGLMTRGDFGCILFEVKDD